MRRLYAVFKTTTGELIGSMDWESVQGIYGKDPDSIRAVYRTKRTYKHRVRWVCSGLDANAFENRIELDGLNKRRIDSGNCRLNELGALSM